MSARRVDVNRDIRAEQLAAAAAFRNSMALRGTLVVRLISSPGAGKTTLLEKTAGILSRGNVLGVLVGDVETQRDAQRLAPYAPVAQITTGGACHLEFPLIEKHLPRLGRSRLDFLFVEDVGNLICPASHDLGEHLRVILLSATEGDDKPGKYPKEFRTSQSMVVTKTDLLPHVPFSVDSAIRDAQRVQPQIRAFALSAIQGENLDSWISHLQDERRRLLRETPLDPLIAAT